MSSRPPHYAEEEALVLFSMRCSIGWRRTTSPPWATLSLPGVERQFLDRDGKPRSVSQIPRRSLHGTAASRGISRDALSSRLRSRAPPVR